MNSFILYEGLPISAGGAHQLNRKDAKEIFNSVSDFLRVYTDSTAPKYYHVVMKKLQWKTLFGSIFHFGIPSLNFWNYWSLKQDLVSWSFRTGDVKEMLDFTRADDNLTIGINWQFRFVDPLTRIALPKQDDIPVIDERSGRTGLYLRLSNQTKTLSVYFAFPFESLDEVANEYIKNVQSVLPFKFSDKHWRILKKSSKGNWISRKIEVNV